jgi:hypothetical protein
MNHQLPYLGFATFVGWITFEYIAPRVSARFNKMYYDYLFIQDDRNGGNIQFLNEKLEESDIQSYLRHKELERTTENLMEMIEKFEDKLNYFDLTLKRENDLKKREIFDLKDRVHTLEDQINTWIGKINNSVLVI